MSISNSSTRYGMVWQRQQVDVEKERWSGRNIIITGARPFPGCPATNSQLFQLDQHLPILLLLVKPALEQFQKQTKLAVFSQFIPIDLHLSLLPEESDPIPVDFHSPILDIVLKQNEIFQNCTQQCVVKAVELSLSIAL